MNLHSETSPGQRRAALALHSLGPSDRDWLLKQLPQPEQHVLGGLLSELRGLGIPPDAAVIRAALASVASGDSMTVDEARSLCLVLADEPGEFQGFLLAALPESERGAVLSHWPREQLIRPGAALGQAWQPALRDAVMRSWRELGQGRNEVVR